MDTDWAKENVHLIKEISQNSIELEGGFIKTTTKLKLHDSQAAIVHLMRAHGLFKDYGADFFKFIDVSQLNANQLQRLSAGENILSVLLKSDPDDEADEGEVEDDLPPALPMPTAQSEKKL
jgi:transketolase